MPVYIPSGQFVITWSQIHQLKVYCPSTYGVTQISIDTLEFVDVATPTQPGYITVPILGFSFNSDHVTIDHIISRAWYVTPDLVEHDWNDWQTEFRIEPFGWRKEIRLAVYSFAQLALSHDMPAVPPDYWYRPGFGF
jgi:hypothetical protein